MIKLVTLAAMLAVFAAPAWAQAKECNDEFKSATYQKWYDNRKDHQDVAYAAAKDYLATCTTDDQYTAALKKFVKLMDDANASASLNKQFDDAYKAKAYADQIRIGKQILATDPDNSAVYIVMGMAGLSAPSVLSESVQYAKKAIEMIEAGKPAAPYTRDQALAYLNWEMAKASLKPAPADAIPYLLKAAKFESDLKKNPLLYLDLATAYNDGPRAKLTEEYKAKYTVESPESKLALANINQFIDRQIDAMARAAALAGNAADKKAVMDALTEIYKDRNNKTDGLNELVAGILQKPLPEFPTPLTSLPTPVSTPATSGSASGTNGTTSSNTSTNGQSKTGSTGATGTTGTQSGNKTTSGPKPSPTPTPANKKPRRANHRRG